MGEVQIVTLGSGPFAGGKNTGDLIEHSSQSDAHCVGMRAVFRSGPHRVALPWIKHSSLDSVVTESDFQIAVRTS